MSLNWPVSLVCKSEVEPLQRAWADVASKYSNYVILIVVTRIIQRSTGD
jgi:hypothetical protein